ncbi:hypothetical protein [Candidatus Phytoplasma citri]|uniref:Uncharacterized protein n=2 Tax=Candidatus Phytoplasma citri TaxID=180978 RepID=A0A1S9M5M8_9MOLU|nr:hypothetical protein [Candidatus Phytoplasma aurantifolia]OOP60578.1 hypothetical protein B2G44_00265 [Candidatus Phytoplasma aurantifolia]
MLKVINNIKKNFNINKILFVLMFVITSLFTINYITLNSNFSFQANIQTEENDDILQYLTKMSNNPIIQQKQNKELLDQCTNLLNEYNQIKKDIKNFFINTDVFNNLNNNLFNFAESKKNEIEGQLNTITDLIKNKEDQKQIFENLKEKINEYLDNALEKLKNIVTFFQNIDNQDTTTIESLKDNLIKFKEIYDYLKDENKENYNIIKNQLTDLYSKQQDNETELKKSIDNTRIAISNINNTLEQEIISKQILDEGINDQKLTLSVLINPSLDQKLNNFQTLKNKIDTILNDTNNSSKNNNNEDNFEFSSNNNISFASKLFYLLCILITVTFLLIIYQFNKKNKHKNNSL